MSFEPSPRLLARLPQLLKLLDRRRRKSRVMVVYIHIRRDASSDGLLTYVHPTHQLPGAVHDHFVPDLRLLLNSPSIAEQADVREVRGDGIKLLEDLAHAWHPRLIYERVRKLVLAQQIEEFSRQPLLVADFQREASSGMAPVVPEIPFRT
jgi:hypothetical protein